MNESKTNSGLTKFLIGLGPAFMAVGYTVGTGSVTSMVVAGNNFGMKLLWVLLLSCIFSWVLMEAYGRYTLVTGETALYGIRKNIKGGSLIGILIIMGVVIGQWNSLIGILGISANALYESLSLFFPTLVANKYLTVLLIAIFILALMYFMLWQGRSSVLDKVLLFFVSM